MNKLFEYDLFVLKDRGIKHLVGIDEAGRGCLAGPVVIAAVELDYSAIFSALNDSKKKIVATTSCREPDQHQDDVTTLRVATTSFLDLNDSKQLSSKTRTKLYHEIIANAVQYKIVEVQNFEIDTINIRQASLLGFVLAYEGLKSEADLALIDGRDVPNQLLFKAENLIKGDTLSACIAAASILAKVYRDALMVKFDETYPGYGFAKHKGYGTVEHYNALAKLGACEIHRKSFRLS